MQGGRAQAQEEAAAITRCLPYSGRRGGLLRQAILQGRWCSLRDCILLVPCGWCSCSLLNLLEDILLCWQTFCNEPLG